jgi:hypothetical protein
MPAVGRERFMATYDRWAREGFGGRWARLWANDKEREKARGSGGSGPGGEARGASGSGAAGLYLGKRCGSADSAVCVYPPPFLHRTSSSARGSGF